MFEWVKTRISIPHYQHSMWTSSARKALDEFLSSEFNTEEASLVCFIDNMKFIVQKNLPQEYSGELMYFIKVPRKANLTLKKESSQGERNSSGPEPYEIQYGSMHSKAMSSLYKLMSTIYTPILLENDNWPESSVFPVGVRRELTGQLHKFMASLVETTHQLKSQTVLYIPNENLSDLRAAAQNKDLVQRLESTLIHWTRQIKEVISNQDNIELAVDAGPLTEIQFWRSRTVDLSSIRNQIMLHSVEQIKEVLELAKSSYLDPFLKLSYLIQQGSLEAQNNLNFLSLLSPPCEALAKAQPREIADILPGILHRIRFIWESSQYYTTPERVVGLLRKVSNEIINRCAAKISLQEIYRGDVETCIEDLCASIDAGESWKKLYMKTTAAIEHNYNQGSCKRLWNFEWSSVFAHTEAFVQRCRDLVEVCEGQIQFARKQGSKKTKVPSFGGSGGPEIIKTLCDIEAQFERHLHGLELLDYDILDVKATQWHDDFNTFKRGLKDLEVMFQNVINTAFESVTTVVAGVELVNVFRKLAKRESIQRTIEKKAAEVYEIFGENLQTVRDEFENGRKNPPILLSHPKFAGAALWAMSLKKRSLREWNLFKLWDGYASISLKSELEHQFLQTSSALQDFLNKSYQEWLGTLDKDMLSKLDVSLIKRNPTNNLLESNFDHSLMRLFTEVKYWLGIKKTIPPHVLSIYEKNESMRILRENVMFLVRDYNYIMKSLGSGERKLFRERIRTLDKVIEPGLFKLHWSSGNAVDAFLQSCRDGAHGVQKTVTMFKNSYASIQQNCDVIAMKNLVSIRKKFCYSKPEFDEKQHSHCNKVTSAFQKIHADIVATLKTCYEVFKEDSEEVHKQWRLFVEKVDIMIEDALRETVKASLIEILRSLIGDDKNDVSPLLLVKVYLDMQSVSFGPPLKELDTTIMDSANNLIATLNAIPRVSLALFQDLNEVIIEKDEETTAEVSVKGEDADIFSSDRSKQTFFEIMCNDEEILKILATINEGIKKNNEFLTHYLTKWDEYRSLWEVDKDAYMRRYKQSNRPLNAFEADIARQQEIQDKIEREETITNIKYIRVDCSPLKYSLISHCNSWQNKYTELLRLIATQELNDLHAMFNDITQKLKTPPRNLDMLKTSLGLWNEMTNDQQKIEGRFEPLEKKIRVLEKFDVRFSESEILLRESLPQIWATFKVTLGDADSMLKSKKERFKAELIKSIKDFGTTVSNFRQEFLQKGPFSASISFEKAAKLIKEFVKQHQEIVEKENKLKNGLEIFNMDPPSNKELALTLKELDLLEKIWELTFEWDKAWESWKNIKFTDLNVSKMQEESQKYEKRLVKLGRDLKQMEVWVSLRERIAHFKQGMPLIEDLKNPSLRPRHWEKLQEEVGKPFDPMVDTFTLDTIFLLGLDGYADVISNLSVSATKELDIEHKLQDIEIRWNELEFDLSLQKESGQYHLKSCEEVFQLLEDNQVTLSNIKASRFFFAFESQVEKWECALSRILETIEIMLMVQRQWLYLENIFCASEDIRRQMPAESAIFDKVNSNWKSIMDKIASDSNVRRGTHFEGLFEMLTDMNLKLEKIQKSLDQYLETKRMYFPRFYFLSNDDLLEILGQSRNPKAVQKHLRKCFDNIRLLEFERPEGAFSSQQQQKDSKKRSLIKQSDNQDAYGTLATGMHSAEGEFVSFQVPVAAEGPVEIWLQSVEGAMRLSLKKELHHALIGFKKFRKDKFLRDTPGQLIIVSSQISWTMMCQRALEGIAIGEKNALRDLRRKHALTLKRLSEMVKGQLSNLNRLKLVALLTIEIHQRDVIERLLKGGVQSEKDFDWRSQLRFYWEKDEEECRIHQTNAVFPYGYEYLGNTGRLVITPLTDKVYMALTTSLMLKKGGNPQGPAGTGKTETVKDLGKALAKYCLVFNCSEALDAKSMGQSFSGLAQTGAWSCFDEFNRIDIEVLSVVAQQISSILNAIAGGKRRFVFEGTEIKLNNACGIFVTMNPGYAGRTEFPDNLKSLFRPVAMMVPDFAMIAEIILFSEGFTTAKFLSRKIVTLYDLSGQQLSKQDHYDFTLRSIKSVLVASGALKRADPELPEDLVLLRALRDMNIPKLTSEDVILFMAILSDLFPGAEPPEVFYGQLQVAIEAELTSQNFQHSPSLIKKIIQLYETRQTRHGIMVVGETGSGKSTVWKTLANSLNRLNREKVSGFHHVRHQMINPKAINMEELYGGYDRNTHEWHDGILSNMMYSLAADERKEEKWIVFDGPVDTLWIESMNSVLDDNKVLTLTNGKRILMTDDMLLLFEVGNLKQASPATVSRCGMIYLTVDTIGWRAYIDSWISKKPDHEMREILIGKNYPPASKESRNGTATQTYPHQRPNPLF